MTERPPSSEQRISWLFESTGHEVSQSVGNEPGRVDYFAVPRTGFVRPRTCWKAWETCPVDIEIALEELEATRRKHNADRALGIIMQGGLPAGHSTELSERTTSAISFRRLLLELSGIADDVRRATRAQNSAESASFFLPRRGRTGEGDVVDVISYAKNWLTTEHEKHLAIIVPRGSGKEQLVRESIRQFSEAFAADPENAIPVLDVSGLIEARVPMSNTREEAFRMGWAVRVIRSIRVPSAPRSIITLPMEGRILLFLEQDKLSFFQEGQQRTFISIELISPEPSEIERSIRSRLSPEQSERFWSAYRHLDAFREIAEVPTGLSLLVEAARFVDVVFGTPLVEWVARVTAGCVDLAFKEREWLRKDFERMAQVAFEQFALGQGGNIGYASNAELFGEELRWTHVVLDSDRTPRSSHGFKSILIRDYFIAVKIASEVRASRLEVLTRYQFPREYVLLFLAIIAPDVAAQATADRGAEIRASIESEVERRLQLTLAHMLRRSAGAVRSHIKTIKKIISESELNTLQREFSRIDQELTFQSALAEHTRRLEELPKAVFEGLATEELVSLIVQHLRETYPQVQCAVEIDPSIRVRASRDGLQEVLHCLLENAFHATAFAEGLENPRVIVKGKIIGDTVRIDILDNGVGVSQEDQVRIFEPYVTTKKGGEGRPLGTGMGLAIAKRYAQHMGGRVGFTPNQQDTCFYVELVTWKEQL